MQKGKGGQLTAFIIVGVVLLIALGLAIYSDAIKRKASGFEPRTLSETEASRAFLAKQVEGCLENALYQGIRRIGKNGGYIDVTGSFTYGDEGELELFAEGPTVAVFRGQAAAIGVAQNKNRLLPLDASIAKLRRYVLVEMNNCDLSALTQQGWSVRQPRIPWVDADFNSAAVTLNYSNKRPDVNIIVLPERVMATLTYPVLASAGSNKMSVDSYTASVPVRLGLVHEIANKAANLTARGERITQICDTLAPAINIYTLGGVQVIDSAPTQRGTASFIYQFGVEGTRAEGRCG